MENTAVLNIRISEQLKHKLEELAKERDETVSDLVREILETAVTQGNDIASGIPDELMSRIKAESQRRKQTESRIIEQALNYAFNTLRNGVFRRW